MNGTDRTVLLDVPSVPLAQVLNDVLAADGSTVHMVPSTLTPEAIVTRYPSIDALILSPLPIPPQPADSGAIVHWEMAGEPALRHCIDIITTVGANMLARRRGVILVIGGLSGLSGWPGWALTSTLEGALVALTRSLACEWAPHGVRVLYLATGPTEEAVPGEPSTADSFAGRTPLKRLATPEEIAGVVQYLVGARASFLTGTPVRADGGWSAWGLLK